MIDPLEIGRCPSAIPASGWHVVRLFSGRYGGFRSMSMLFACPLRSAYVWFVVNLSRRESTAGSAYLYIRSSY